MRLQKEFTVVTFTVEELVCSVRDQMIAEGYATDAQGINRGNCDIFADRLAHEIKTHSPGDLTNFGEREICDYFEDREESGSPLVRDKLLRELPDMTPPAGMSWVQLDHVIERSGMGWGIHVFVVHNGKAYDSETPDGVTSFLDLPSYQRTLAFFTDRYGPLSALEEPQEAPAP